MEVGNFFPYSIILKEIFLSLISAIAPGSFAIWWYNLDIFQIWIFYIYLQRKSRAYTLWPITETEFPAVEGAVYAEFILDYLFFFQIEVGSVW